MYNTLSVRMDGSNPTDLRFWIAIDGEELFQLGEACLEESVLGPSDAADGTVQLNVYREFPDERVVDYGFCIEDCCPSKLVRVSAEHEVVTWRGIRYTVANALDGDGVRGEYRFQRSAYDDECRRALISLCQHYQRVCHDLRYPSTPRADPDVGNPPPMTGEQPA